MYGLRPLLHGSVTQLVEWQMENLLVGGSSPSAPTFDSVAQLVELPPFKR